MSCMLRLLRWALRISLRRRPVPDKVRAGMEAGETIITEAVAIIMAMAIPGGREEADSSSRVVHPGGKSAKAGLRISNTVVLDR